LPDHADAVLWTSADSFQFNASYELAYPLLAFVERNTIENSRTEAARTANI
jgi:hypothetical protein